MRPARLPRRSPWRVLRVHASTAAAHVAYPHTTPLAYSQPPLLRVPMRAFSASGMDAFMEFEREMAKKRRLTNPKPVSVVRRERPIPPKDDECCKLDCPNCVLLVYQEQLLDYELSLQANNAPSTKPPPPEPKYTITFLDAEPTTEQHEQLRLNDKLLYTIECNQLISEPHTTKDGFVRSVRHIDLHVAPDQRQQIGEDASNIAVFVPNDTSVVDRLLTRLRVDPDLVFTIAPMVSVPTTTTSPVVTRPFDTIGSVREALTWSLDLVSTPRPSFLSLLAAYAADDDEVQALLAPTALATIHENRPGQRITLVDVLEAFPSVHLDFVSFYQIAPLNAPRYYTVSSSRRLYPDTVSLTLGLRKLATQPTPRCSSYLASLKPTVDRVRATFFQSSFVFPHRNRKPLMLISAGTGIAPFRAFLQDLEHEQEASGEHNHREAYLFYGCRRRDLDFLYSDDMERAAKKGYLDNLFVEFSATPGQPKRHVQDALAEQGALVARHLVDRDGYVYVCGSLAMGRAVKRVILDSLREHGHFADHNNNHHNTAGNPPADDEAKHFFTTCLATGRIVTELW